MRRINNRNWARLGMRDLYGGPVLVVGNIRQYSSYRKKARRIRVLSDEDSGVGRKFSVAGFGPSSASNRADVRRKYISVSLSIVLERWQIEMIDERLKGTENPMLEKYCSRNAAETSIGLVSARMLGTFAIACASGNTIGPRSFSKTDKRMVLRLKRKPCKQHDDADMRECRSRRDSTKKRVLRRSSGGRRWRCVMLDACLAFGSRV